MPEKEKVKDVQALADTLDSLPETVKQRILGVAEGYQLAIDASKEKEGYSTNRVDALRKEGPIDCV